MLCINEAHWWPFPMFWQSFSIGTMSSTESPTGVHSSIFSCSEVMVCVLGPDTHTRFQFGRKPSKEGVFEESTFGQHGGRGILFHMGSAGYLVSSTVQSEREAPSGMSCGVCVQGWCHWGFTGTAPASWFEQVSHVRRAWRSDLPSQFTVALNVWFCCSWQNGLCCFSQERALLHMHSSWSWAQVHHLMPMISHTCMEHLRLNPFYSFWQLGAFWWKWLENP